MSKTVKRNKYTVKTYDLPGFTLIETVYVNQFRMPSHIHESASLCLVLEGAYSENFERKSRHCQASTMTIYPPGTKHTVDFPNAQVRTLDVVINQERYRQIGQYSTIMNCPDNFSGGEIGYLVNRLYREFNCRDEISALAIEGIILEILAASARKVKYQNACLNAPYWLSKVEELLRAKFADSLKLEEIANLAGVHSGHLARVFRERYNCTVGEYIRKLRIDFACQLLSQSATPLAEIALAAGFADQSHFSKTFKARRGMTPIQYRNIFYRG